MTIAIIFPLCWFLLGLVGYALFQFHTRVQARMCWTRGDRAMGLFFVLFGPPFLLTMTMIIVGIFLFDTFDSDTPASW